MKKIISDPFVVFYVEWTQKLFVVFFVGCSVFICFFTQFLIAKSFLFLFKAFYTDSSTDRVVIPNWMFVCVNFGRVAARD